MIRSFVQKIGHQSRALLQRSSTVFGRHSALVTSLFIPFRELKIIRQFPTYFDPNEQRMVITSILISVIVWAASFSLREAIRWSFDELVNWLDRGQSPFFVLLPISIGALIVAALARFGSGVVHYRDPSGKLRQLNDVEGDGIERTIALYYSSEPALEQALLGKEGVDVRWELPTFNLALRKFAASLATLGSGGSGGMGGSVALIGESLAAALLKPRNFYGKSPAIQQWRSWLRSNHTDALQTAQLAGVAAALSTLLGTPLAAAFFATEVMYRRRPVIEKLLYALIAALVAFLLNSLVLPEQVDLLRVPFPLPPPSTLLYYLAVIVMALAVSLVSAYFGRMQEQFASRFSEKIPNVWLRHLTGAIITGLIAATVVYLTGHSINIVLGPGEEIVQEALMGQLSVQVALIALVAKLIATLSTIGSGGSAGLLVPAIFFGAMTATVVAAIFDQPASAMVIPSITASMVATVNVPLAAIVYTIEAFGVNYMLPSLVALVITLIFAHDNGIYRTQREWDEGRTILPGYSVRRIAVPRDWAGRTVIELNLRARYGINVIGIIESDSASRPTSRTVQQRIRPDVSPLYPLKLGDLLIILGKDESLEAMIESLAD